MIDIASYKVLFIQELQSQNTGTKNMTCTDEVVHARFFESDKYSGATDGVIPLGYPSMSVPGARDNWGPITQSLLEAQDRMPKENGVPSKS